MRVRSLQRLLREQEASAFLAVVGKLTDAVAAFAVEGFAFFPMIHNSSWPVCHQVESSHGQLNLRPIECHVLHRDQLSRQNQK